MKPIPESLVRILEVLRRSPDPLTVAQIAERAGLARVTVWKQIKKNLSRIEVLESNTCPVSNKKSLTYCLRNREK